MGKSPLVSVICLCYNHEKYVEEAIRSVLDQTYTNIEIIVCDDASSDQSVMKIQALIEKNSHIQFIQNPKNIGNCRSFNNAFQLSKGEFIIDLAADDILLPDRIAKGVDELMTAGNAYGIHYGNVIEIDELGNTLSENNKKLPSGDLYTLLIEKYVVNPVSMMIRREVLESMGGYDPELTYEDFDLWIRSSRNYQYLASDDFLVKKRILKHSLSSKQFQFGSKHAKSTFKVCEKIRHLNKNSNEDLALKKRIRYELRQSIKYIRWNMIFKYLRLLISIR